MPICSLASGERLPGTRVKVCQGNKKNCQELGRIDEAQKDDCTVVEGEALEGNMIRLFNSDGGLAICEMKIFGTKKGSHKGNKG